MTYDKITISGLICTGKSTLFAALKKELGWPSFSASQFFRQYSLEHGLSIDKAEEQNEKISKDVDLSMQEMLKGDGPVLLEGWMAGIMATINQPVLKILLTCNDAVRIARFARRGNIDLATAKAQIQERETNLFKKLQKIYGLSTIVDPGNYNFILDTTDESPETTLKKVLKML